MVKTPQIPNYNKSKEFVYTFDKMVRSNSMKHTIHKWSMIKYQSLNTKRNKNLKKRKNYLACSGISMIRSCLNTFVRNASSTSSEPPRKKLRCYICYSNKVKR